MALKKYESETETTSTTEEVAMDTPNTVVDTPAVMPPAVVKEAAKAVATIRSFAPALQEMENVISPADVADLGPGAFPKITVDLGGFLMDKKDVGTNIKVELISWNKRWIVSTNTQDAEATDLLRFSMDGETLQNDHRTVKEYVAFLRDSEGYKNAGAKEYYSLWCNLIYASGADVAVADQKMVEVQLSPQSVGQFKAFQIEYGMKVSKGVMPATNLLNLHSEKKEIKTTRFGIVRFAAIL